MVVKVLSKVGQAFSRSLGSLSLADGSMLLRIRRASIALLGLVGVVALGMIIFISQLGWPGVLSGPLPGSPSRVGTIDDAIALSRPGAAATASQPAAIAPGRPAQDQGAGRQGRRSAGGDSQLGNAKGVVTGPGAQPGPGVDQPTAEQPSSPQPPAAEPTPAAPTPAASPTTPTVENPPQSSSADQAKKATSTAKAPETSVAKAVSDSSKSAGAKATKSQGQKSAKDRGSSPTSSKSSEASSTKAKRDEGAAKAKAKAPPPVVTPEKSAPTTPSPAAAKEAADAANSD